MQLQVQKKAARLGSLTEWSMQHIRDVFEAQDDQQALRAVSETFADNVRVSKNGVPMTRHQVDHMVLKLRRNAPEGLRVRWQRAEDIPQDPTTNRVSCFIPLED